MTDLTTTIATEIHNEYEEIEVREVLFAKEGETDKNEKLLLAIIRYYDSYEDSLEGVYEPVSRYGLFMKTSLESLIQTVNGIVS